MRRLPARGFSLVESIILIGILTFIFVGVFFGARSALLLMVESRAETTALTLANDRIEYIRSLAYDAVGTDGGVPTGAIPQQSTTTVNGITYTERVLVEYVDDPADGQAAADANGITTDYKRVRVEYAWETLAQSQDLVLTTNVIPRSIETDVGGGTLRVNVFDAAVAPVVNAEVSVRNTNVSPDIDLVRYTNDEGVALVGGAPAASGYEIAVTDTGFSTDQTYRATTSLPNPDTAPVTVVEADVTTVNFFIDELSDRLIRARSAEVRDTALRATDTVGAGIATTTNLTVTSTSTQLQWNSGAYAATGTVVTTPVFPSPIEEWHMARIQASTSPATAVRLRVYNGTNTDSLVPEADLPGNSAGFTDDVNLFALNPAVYPVLTFAAELTTTDTNVTPSLSAVAVDYLRDVTPASGVALTLRSDKSIGTDSAGEAVPKHILTGTTDSDGEWLVDDMEWDAYTLVPPSGQALARVCPQHPLVVLPGTTDTVDVLLTPASAHSLRVRVENSGGDPVAGADVSISNGGAPSTATTGPCGQVYFGGLTEADYTISVTGVDPVPADQTVSVASTTEYIFGL